MGNTLEFETISGPTHVAGGVRVTPEAQVFRVRLPFGGLVWSRPSGVVIEREGRLERRPILDVTRLIQVALWVSVLAVGVATWRASNKREERAT
jgi:hypothetical protein